MNNRRIVAGLAAMGAVAAMNVLAACTPSDDNDVFTTPTVEPTPEPTPEFAEHCQIIWANQNGSALDVFVVDGPAELWINGAEAGSDIDFTRYYEEDVTLVGGIYEPGAPIAIVKTNGTFDLSLTIAGTSEGGAVGYSDTTPDTLLGFDTAGNVTTMAIGTANKGYFTGEWSNPAAPVPSDVTDCDPVQTLDQPCLVTLRLGTAAAFTVGNFGSYAACYQQEL